MEDCQITRNLTQYGGIAHPPQKKNKKKTKERKGLKVFWYAYNVWQIPTQKTGEYFVGKTMGAVWKDLKHLNSSLDTHKPSNNDLSIHKLFRVPFHLKKTNISTFINTLKVALNPPVTEVHTHQTKGEGRAGRTSQWNWSTQSRRPQSSWQHPRDSVKLQSLMRTLKKRDSFQAWH